jgi:hypothetical protein
MTLQEAKERKDYRFECDSIEAYREELIRGEMGWYWKYMEPQRGEAVLEIGCVDIECNISTWGLSAKETAEDDMRPLVSYFVCLVIDDDGQEKTWESDRYLEVPINVDWASSNWKEQLEMDMYQALDAYVLEKGYSYDNPNRPYWKYNYQIMAEGQKNSYGNYIPDFKQLIAGATCDEEVAYINEVKDRNDEWSQKNGYKLFEGYAYNMVYITKLTCGHFEMFQTPYNEYHTLQNNFAMAEEYAKENRCTRCISNFSKRK